MTINSTIPGLKILIADDNHSVRRALQLMLETLGHDVAGIAVDGQQALDLYDKVLPDVLFLDVRMPNMHGLDALQLILAKHPAASIVIYTGGESCEKEALALGAVGYLEKPFGLDAVVREIGKVIVRRSPSVQPGPPAGST
jgi:CheY-like chemotaxis protein